MTLNKTNMAKTFDLTSQNYGGGTDFFTIGAKKLFNWADLNDGINLLDYGTGRGAALFAAVEYLNGSGTVTGIDISEQMISQLQNEVNDKNIQNVSLAVMDGENLKFNENTFDVVISSAVIHLIEDKLAGLKQIYRVLKTGGVFAFSVPGEPPSSEWAFHKELYEKYLPTINPKLWQPSQDQKNTDYLMLLKEAGFVDISTEHMPVEISFKNADEFWNWQMSHSRRGFIEALSEDNKNNYKKEVYESINKMGDNIVMVRDSLFIKAHRHKGSS
jgi:ubiquinone/menaquinone biosynthesis C-methylase UbiE